MVLTKILMICVNSHDEEKRLGEYLSVERAIDSTMLSKSRPSLYIPTLLSPFSSLRWFQLVSVFRCALARADTGCVCLYRHNDKARREWSGLRSSWRSLTLRNVQSKLPKLYVGQMKNGERQDGEWALLLVNYRRHSHKIIAHANVRVTRTAYITERQGNRFWLISSSDSGYYDEMLLDKSSKDSCIRQLKRYNSSRVICAEWERSCGKIFLISIPRIY